MVYEKFIKELSVYSKIENDPNTNLIKSIIQTRDDLETANRNFEFAEGDLIDYYLYKIKATKVKYDYLIKKAKRAGILVNRTTEIAIKNLDEVI